MPEVLAADVKSKPPRGKKPRRAGAGLQHLIDKPGPTLPPPPAYGPLPPPNEPPTKKRPTILEAPKSVCPACMGAGTRRGKRLDNPELDNLYDVSVCSTCQGERVVDAVTYRNYLVEHPNCLAARKANQTPEKP